MLFSEPLGQWLLLGENLARFEKLRSKQVCSGSWRDYRGSWEIRESRLYLVRIETDPCDEKPREIPLGSLFPVEPGAVFASWYTGSLVVPVGRQLAYVHMGYQSRYERYIVFTIKGGVVASKTETTDMPR